MDFTSHADYKRAARQLARERYHEQAARFPRPTKMCADADAVWETCELARKMARYSFESFPIPNRVLVIARAAEVVMSVDFFVPDRETGEPITVTMMSSLTKEAALILSGEGSPFDLDEYMRRTMLDMLMHEADEHLRRDGALVVDPHRHER